MAVTAPGYWYGSALTKLANKEVDVDSDTIKAALVSSSYTPNRDTHDYWDDVVANEVTGTNWAANGVTLTTVAIGVVAANSWATARANSTAYTVGQVVRPSTGNGFLYMCITAGTSAGSAPTYPTSYGGTVSDGTATWLCVARGAFRMDADDISVATVTVTGVRYVVFYDRTPASDATRPLLGYLDLGTDQAATAGSVSVTFDATGILWDLYQ